MPEAGADADAAADDTPADDTPADDTPADDTPADADGKFHLYEIPIDSEGRCSAEEAAKIVAKTKELYPDIERLYDSTAQAF